MWSDIWNVSYIELRIWNQVSYDHRSYECNLRNCVQKPEKVRTSTGFEPVTSRYRCNALTNWAMKPLTLGAGHSSLEIRLCRYVCREENYSASFQGCSCNVLVHSQTRKPTLPSPTYIKAYLESFCHGKSNCLYAAVTLSSS